jgi:hypothetical protein
VILVVLAARAYAQECHPLPGAHVPEPAPHEQPADKLHGDRIVGVRAGFALETAAIDDGLGRHGSYRGAVTSLELQALGARARVAIGAYDVDWGQRARGLGDTQLAIQRAIVTAGGTDLGAAMSATLPTGDPRGELGMGHPMVMPALWARHAWPRSSLLASIVYGSMLGGHHHGMVEPITSPMNAEELAAAIRGGYTWGRMELAATVSGAVPIGEGLARGAVTGSARWVLGASELALDLSLPAGGTPIQARGVVELSRGF